MTLPDTDKGMRDDRLLKYDRFVFAVIMAHLPVVMFLVPIGYDTSAFAIVASLIIGLLAVLGYLLVRGTPAFGLLAGVLLMGFSAVMIQTQLGRLEMHFHIFSSLAILLIYRNWVAIVVPAAVIAVHHLLFTYLQLEGVTLAGVPVLAFAFDCSWSLTLIHAAFVVFESAFLVYFALMMRREDRASINLVEAIRRVQQEQDLSIRIESNVPGEAAEEFNGLLENFDMLTRDISTASDSINQTARQLDESSIESQQALNLQNEKTNAVVGAMSSMSSATELLTQKIEEVAGTANNANSQANSASSEVASVVALSKQLGVSMAQTSDSISQLARSAESIGSVVDVIRGISEQTNLLALNAAIEAARAGESGRGFAVVADEVRTLAQRTQSSTEEIQSIIETLQHVTKDAVSNIDEGQKITQQSIEGVTGTNQALGLVFEAVKSINQMNLDLSEMAKQQELTISSVTDNINTISELGSKSTSKLKENLENVSALNNVNQTLTQRLIKYKLA